MWEKEKLLDSSNFSFSHSVFKRLVLQTRENQGLFGKGLSIIFINLVSIQISPCFQILFPNFCWTQTLLTTYTSILTLILYEFHLQLKFRNCLPIHGWGVLCRIGLYLIIGMQHGSLIFI